LERQTFQVGRRGRNRVSPTGQYSTEDGVGNDWHHVHLGLSAVGGAGMVSKRSPIFHSVPAMFSRRDGKIPEQSLPDVRLE
jgi:hypothetical protein